MTRTPEYKAWQGMKDRCFNPNHKHFHHYGGRGITVCDRWLSFTNFYEDVGNRPTDKHSIERIENDGNYAPGNCTWATRSQQMRNIRSRSKSGVKGVYKKRNKWVAEIDGNRIGTFATIEDAANARREAEKLNW